jgi:methyltransferase (TIGR00027 family)
MIEDQPSRTAQRVAIRRAMHQLWDNPRIFDDPVALQIIGADEAAMLSGSRPADPLLERYLRAFLVARSRYAEDQLAKAVWQGVKQYVILGAGLDTFAYRNPFSGLRVFEVDHPATQAWKRKRLKSGRISVPASLTFVPTDFHEQALAQVLEQAGFKAGQPAFFSWLGVTPYLASETVLGTLQWLISICSGNGVAFDYAVPRSSLDPSYWPAFDDLSSRVAAAGEPFVGFFEGKELARAMRKMGFAQIEDLGADEINARYFNGRTDGLSVGGAGRLMGAKGQ